MVTANVNQGGYAQELAKYGEITGGGNFTAQAGAVAGTMIEYGTVSTNKIGIKIITLYMESQLLWQLHYQ
ncbi:hypothetical protein [Mucilaginibacter oryzae]|uniref:hypothetical protein n=1 Tax=Mucilaginibacter oryzae TaxID=468058 RepID=UPI000D6ADA7E|nr:hypothetical protein [Mucilaginibacter oryzae]